MVKRLSVKSIKSLFLIGPEGGFSQREREMFEEKVRLKGFILRSESAACAIASKILL
jgi:16S rRNA (uracil1498-N3)-methyltransferase